MSSHNRHRRNYVDMVVASRPHASQPTKAMPKVSAATEQAIIQKHYRRLLAKRIRRVARVAVIASKNNLTVRQLRVRVFRRQAKHSMQVLHTNQYRIIAAVFVVVFAVTSLVNPLIDANKNKLFQLPEDTKRLIGDSRDDTKEYLSYDANNRQYSFALNSQAEGANTKHSGRVADAYSLIASQNANDGITVTETKTKIAMTIVPNFFTAPVKKADGDHLVYQSGSRQVIYTLKYNGLKEDIIIPKNQGSEMNFDFTLRLPSGVEARLDDDGNIGIYSSDPALFGSINYSTDEDRIRVEHAREAAAKNNLVTTIPFPVVKDAGGTEHTNLARFALSDKTTKQVQAATISHDVRKPNTTINEYKLSLNAFNLGDLAYPISVDPTMQVTSSADFSKLNQESGSEVDTTNNLIKRVSVSGGELNGWSSTGSGLTARYGASTTIYNGFIYISGGCLTNQVVTNVCTAVTNTVMKAPVSSSGIGTWTTETALPDNVWQHNMVVYNGYLYVISGGYNTTPNGSPYIYSVKINSNGSLGSTWKTTFDLCCQLYASSFVYNGYMYRLGGSASGANTAAVYYAKINGDGTWGTFTTTTAMPTAIFEAALSVYNGRVYVIGGCTNTNPCSTYTNAVISAQINTDGTLSSWTSRTSITTARRNPVSWVNAGYLYVTGGQTTSSLGDTQYAPIYADGSLGSWLPTSSLGTVRDHASSAFANGILYVVGGENGGTPLSTSEYASIKTAGALGSTSTGGSGAAHASTLPVAAAGVASSVENGFLYIAGGQTSTGYNNHIYHTKLNTDGTFSYPGDGANGVCSAVSTVWCDDGLYTGAALIDGYAGSSMVIAKHCMMLIGGVNGSGATNNVYLAPLTFSGSAGGSNSNDGQIGTVVIANNKPTARAYGTANYYNGFIFYAGGVNGTTYNTIVQRTTVNNSNCSLGTLTSWVTDANMGTPRAYHTAFRRQDHLYFIGGYSASGNNVLSSGDNLNFGISMTGFTNAINTPLAGAGAAESNGFLYLVGGTTSNSTGALDSSTRRLSAGSVTNPVSTNWTNDTTPKSPAPSGGINRNAAIAANGFLYSLGGCTAGAANTTCTAFTSTIYVSTINNGGSGTLDVTNSSVNWGTRKSATTYAQNGYFYSIGGCPQSVDCSSAGTPASMSTTVSYTKQNSDGSLNNCNGSGGWCDLTAVSNGALPDCRAGGTALSLGNYIYYFGGYADCTSGAATTNVLFAAVDSAGALSKPNNSCTLHNASTSTVWCDAATLPAGYSTLSLGEKRGAVYNSVFYLYDPSNNNFAYIGQNSATGELVTPSGCVTTFTSTLYCQTTSPFSTGGVGYQAGPLSPYRGRMYIIGGSDGGPNVNSASAPINSDGSMGTWRRENQMPFTRNTSQSAVLDGFAYSFFGYDSNDILVNCYSGMLRAPILADGSIGEWQSVYNGTAFNTFAAGEALIVGHRIYSFNGTCGNPNVLQPSLIFTPRSLVRSAQFSRLYDFDTGVKPTKLITRGSKQAGASFSATYTSSNNTAVSLTNAQSLSVISLGGSGAATINLGGNITLTRYLFIRYGLDDSTSAAFPDAGNESYVTDFDQYYIANTGERLRGGRTFTNGADRGLDAQPQ